MWPRVARFLGQSRPFWTWLLDHWRRPPHTLGHAVAEAQALLRADGLDVDVLRTVPMFGELSVSNGDDTCIVDLVAEPFPPIAPPQRATIEDAEILVDSRHEILVSKLTALLGRSELHDLIDVQTLLEAEADLVAALQDAPKKDAGFSAITLARVLHTFEIGPLAHALGWSAEQTVSLDAFRRQLIDRLTQMTRPE